MKKALLVLAMFGLFIPLGNVGCHTHMGRMAVAGALVGAAIGSTAPGYCRDRSILTGAAVGAAVGASVGAEQQYGTYYAPRPRVYIAPRPSIIIETHTPRYHRHHRSRYYHSYGH